VSAARPCGRIAAATALLLAATLPAVAQDVSGRLLLSHDSDDFDERIASVGWTGASGFGLRAGAAHYHAPGWSADGVSLAATYRDEAPTRKLDASLGIARVGGHDHAVGALDYLRPLAPGSSIGLSAERDIVNSVEGIRQGLTHNSVALVADHAFTPRFNVGLAAGATFFSDDNRRPFLRTRWNFELEPNYGLNAYARTRSYRNSDPGRPAYYSPDRLNELSAGLSSRFAVAERFVLAAHADAGTQRTEAGGESVWSYSLGVASLRNARLKWSVALQASNAASQFNASGAYRYTTLIAQLGVPL
jgi:hypothetical protein